MGWLRTAFREFRRRQPDVELVVHHLLSVHQVDAVLSDRLDAGFAATITPWHKDLAHRQFAQERLVLAVPKGHPLTKLTTNSVAGFAEHVVRRVPALGQSGLL